jgi:hypothetical protein
MVRLGLLALAAISFLFATAAAVPAGAGFFLSRTGWHPL